MKSLLGRLLGKAGRPVSTIFVAAADPASRRMVDRIQDLLPDHDHLLASWGQVDRSRFRHVDELVCLEPGRPARSLLRLRRRLFRRWTGFTSFLLPAGGSSAPGWRLWALLWLAPGRLLAFNAQGEWRHLRLSAPLASWRFLRGWPLGELERPTPLWWMRDALGLFPAALLFAGWLSARLRHSAVESVSEQPAAGGFTMMCLPGDDFHSRLDREVAASSAAEILATREPRLPEAETIRAMRACLEQPGVWLVCARAGFKHLLSESWAPHREHESGTFCLGASSSLILFRRDVYLQLGGLGRLDERALPSLALLGWLRGHKTVYAGHIEFRGQPMSGVSRKSLEGHPLGPLIVAGLDHAPSAFRLLYRHGRQITFWGPYWRSVGRARPVRLRGPRGSALLPLVEPGAVVFRGRSQTGRVRLAMLTPELPYPLDRPAAARVYPLLRSLAQDCEIHLFSFSRKESSGQIEALLEFCSRLIVLRPPLWERPRPLRLRPAGVGRYRGPQMRAYLEQWLADFQIPLVEVESTQLAFFGAWLQPSPVAKILAAQDVRFHLEAQVASRQQGLERLRARAEALRWKRQELAGMRQFDRILTACEIDRQRLITRGLAGESIEVVTNGIDPERFRALNTDPDQGRVLFVEPPQHAANDLGRRFLLEEVWPRIIAQRPNASLTVVAAPNSVASRSQPRAEVPPPGSLPQGVERLESVGDVRPLYERSSVVVMPLPVATAGAQVKVLEAWAMGRALVATRQSCAGLAPHPDGHLLLAEDAETFAAAVIRLLADRELRRRLAEAGRRHVEGNFDCRNLAAKHLRLYEELLGAQRQQATGGG